MARSQYKDIMELWDEVNSMTSPEIDEELYKRGINPRDVKSFISALDDLCRVKRQPKWRLARKSRAFKALGNSALFEMALRRHGKTTIRKPFKGSFVTDEKLDRRLFTSVKIDPEKLTKCTNRWSLKKAKKFAPRVVFVKRRLNNELRVDRELAAKLMMDGLSFQSDVKRDLNGNYILPIYMKHAD
jgi:hypothetical protein